MKIENLCTHEGERFDVTISADAGDGAREVGPTMRACLLCIVGAKVLANELEAVEPGRGIVFDLKPVEVQ